MSSDQPPRQRSTRSISRACRSRTTQENTNERQHQQPEQQQQQEEESNIQIMQRRNRAVAEREASRLARPDRPVQDSTLKHASKDKSAVTSTPFGFFGKSKGKKENEAVQAEEWCGPFSVARQMIAAREAARREREQQQQQQQGEAENPNENENRESHPLDNAIQSLQQDQKRKAHPSLCWKSTKFTNHDDDDFDNNKKRKNNKPKENLYVKRKRRHLRQTEPTHSTKIPSLYQKCVDYLVDNFDYVEALGIGVDTSIRRSICQRLVERGLMNGAAFDVLAEEGIEALELVDCAEVTQSQLSSTLERLIPSGLKALLLHHAGRCFGPQTVQSLITSSSSSSLLPPVPQSFLPPSLYSSPSYNSLFALSIGGAYLLKDEDAAKLVKCMHKTLSSIEFKACPLLGKQFCKSIGECYASSCSKDSSADDDDGNDKERSLLELSLEDLNLKEEHLLFIVGSGNEGAPKTGNPKTEFEIKNDALRNLRNLSLRRIECLDDDILFTIFSSIGLNLESIDFSDNPNITDMTLSYIRKCNIEHNLSSLTLSGCRSLTSVGLEALFTLNIDGLPPPPCLKRLDLSRCGFDVVCDAVVGMAALASLSQTSLSTMTSSSTQPEWKKIPRTGEEGGKGGLVHLNLSGGSITDVAMEKLAVSCVSSLKELNVSFCTKVSNKGLGYLVSKVGRQFRKIHVWGCAQITEEFVDGHDRVDEVGGVGSLLEIEGVWMKKAGNRSIR